MKRIMGTVVVVCSGLAIGVACLWPSPAGVADVGQYRELSETEQLALRGGACNEDCTNVGRTCYWRRACVTQYDCPLGQIVCMDTNDERMCYHNEPDELPCVQLSVVPCNPLRSTNGSCSGWTWGGYCQTSLGDLGNCPINRGQQCQN